VSTSITDHATMTNRSTPLPRAIAAVILSAFAVGCATTTTIEEPAADGTDQPGLEVDGRELADTDVTPIDGGVIVDGEAPATTVPIVGSAAEILPEIGIDVSRLSAEISEDGDEDATLARIQANWAAISGEIERDRPELLNGIQTTIDMATTAVERNRPADADKAFSILNDLIDNFTGDS